MPAFESLRRATFGANPQGGEIAATRELKVWVHRVSPQQESQAIPSQLEVHLNDGTRRYNLELSGGQVVLPLTRASWTVEITVVGR